MDKDFTKEEGLELPHEKASIVSRWTYSWFSSILSKATRKSLTATTYSCPNWLSTSFGSSRFSHYWSQKESNNRSWGWLIISFGGSLLWWSAFLTLIADFSYSLSPKLLQSFISSSSALEKFRYLRLAMLVTFNFGRKVVLDQSVWVLASIAYLFRASIMSSVYEKLLNSKRIWLVGSGINRLSVDTNRICTFVLFGHLVWSHPLRILLSFISALNLVGFPAIFGIGFVLLVLCSLFWLAHVMRRVRKDLAKYSDERLQLTNEILANIKIVKIFSMESFWNSRINKVRELELSGIKKLKLLFAAAASINFWSPVFATTLTVLMASFLNYELDATMIFPMNRAFQMLMVPLWMMPTLVNRSIASSVSANRIDQILSSEQQDPEVPVTVDEVKGGRDPSLTIELENASFGYDDKKVLISNVSFQVDGPALVCIKGAMASGKNALLGGLAKIAELVKGSYNVSPSIDSIGFCPFPGWIRSGSIKDNIVFDREFDPVWFNMVYSACCLTHELAPNIEITEPTSSLSGGQCQRIALARSIYGKPKLLLVGNILSALDKDVAFKIFTNCFGPNGILGNTAIKFIVSNDDWVIERCDSVVELENGQFKNYYKVAVNDKITDPPMSNPNSIPKICRYPNNEGFVSENGHPRFGAMRLILRVIKASGGWIPLLILFSLILGTDLIKFKRDKLLKGISQKGAGETGSILGMILMLGTLHGVVTAGANFLAVFLCINAARFIHKNAFHKIIHAKGSFYQTTNTGKLLNRLGKDLETFDYIFPEKLVSLLGSLSSVLCTILAIIQLIPHLFFSLLIPLIIVTLLFRRFAMTWRILLQLTSQTMAPVSTIFSETVTGMATIKVYKQTNRLLERFQKYCDANTLVSFLSVTSRKWVSFRTDLICSLYIGVIGVYCIHNVKDVGTVGLLMTYSLMASESMAWLLKHLAELDHCLVSVERISFYSDSLPQDPVPEKIVLSNFDAPAIEFDRVRVLCDEEHFALNDISFTIPVGKRVAIIGRTGAGKSTILSAILNLCEYSGDIKILGQTSNSRALTSAVLQETTLFPHLTIKQNLDPENRYQDSYIIENMITGCTTTNLDQLVSELSTGQRQLLAITRALLLQRPILLLDEATGCLEPQLEMEIHKKIVGEYKGTILTVTHREELLPLYDMVMKIEEGRLVTA